jgi:hypothetical protein
LGTDFHIPWRHFFRLLAGKSHSGQVNRVYGQKKFVTPQIFKIWDGPVMTGKHKINMGRTTAGEHG